MPERKRRLDESGNARRGQQMTDIALHRSERAIACAARVGPERRGQRGHLDGIAELRSRAMRFDHLNAVRIKAETVVDILLQRVWASPLGAVMPLVFRPD